MSQSGRGRCRSVRSGCPPVLRSSQLQGGDAARVVLVGRGDRRGAGLAFVFDRERRLDAAGHPDADEAVVVGLPCFVEEHLAVLASERQLNLRVGEFPETGRQAVEVAVVGLLPVGGAIAAHLLWPREQKDNEAAPTGVAAAEPVISDRAVREETEAAEGTLAACQCACVRTV